MSQDHAKLPETSEKKRILFLAPRFPYPAIGGDRVKSYHLLRHLSTIAEVDLIALDEAKTVTAENFRVISDLTNVTIVPFNKVAAGFRILKKLASSTPIEFAYYYSDAMQQAVDEAVSQTKYDLIISFFLRTAPYVASITSVPKILIAEDARVLLQERASKNFELSAQYLVRKIDAGRLAKYEPEMMSRGFDRVTFVAREDEQRIRKQRPNLPTAILTNGVDIEDFEFYDGPKDNAIVFAGHLSVYHNVLMAQRVTRDIYPRLRDKFPDLRLRIVGKSPGAQLTRLVEQTRGAELHADVPDIKPFISRSKVFVHPQSVGAGIQNKLLEAMALGTPVVTTAIGANPIEGLRDGEHAIVRMTDDEIVTAISELLVNEEEAKRLSVAARKLIEAHYTWEEVFSELDKIINEVIPEFVVAGASPTMLPRLSGPDMISGSVRNFGADRNTRAGAGTAPLQREMLTA